MGTPKGRKPKKTAFNFTPKKLDMNTGQTSNVDDSNFNGDIDVVFEMNRPLGLKNICYDDYGDEYCANICFFQFSYSDIGIYSRI